MLTREEIYELLVAGKRMYVQSVGEHSGMCKALDKVCELLFPQVYDFYTYDYLYQIIPVYLDASRCLGGYWWQSGDHESRLKAFDKLIDLYEKKNE